MCAFVTLNKKITYLLTRAPHSQMTIQWVVADGEKISRIHSESNEDIQRCSGESATPLVRVCSIHGDHLVIASTHTRHSCWLETNSACSCCYMNQTDHWRRQLQSTGGACTVQPVLDFQQFLFIGTAQSLTATLCGYLFKHFPFYDSNCCV